MGKKCSDKDECEIQNKWKKNSDHQHVHTRHFGEQVTTLSRLDNAALTVAACCRAWRISIRIGERYIGRLSLRYARVYGELGGQSYFIEVWEVHRGVM